MRGRPLKIIIMICFLILTTAASAIVQATRPTEFDISFDFVMQGRSVPAGKYTVERFDKSRPEILIMRDSEGYRMRIFLTQRVEGEDYKDQQQRIDKLRSQDHY